MIVKHVRHLKERTIESQFHLVDTTAEDTMFIASNFRHSEPEARPFWTKDGNFVIMENSMGGDVAWAIRKGKPWYEISSIVVWNLKENKEQVRIKGFMLTGSNHLDVENNILIYYSVTGKGNDRQSNVMAYDLKAFESKKLFVLKCFKQFHHPRMKFIPGKRQVKIGYVCSNYPNNEELIEFLDY